MEDLFIQTFDRKIVASLRVNLLFILAIILEIAGLVLFTPFFLKSALFALMVALFFLTIFSYFILRQYLESQKHAYFEALLTELPESPPLETARLCTKIAHKLYQREYKYYTPPRFLSFVAPFFEKVSAWMHWHDVHLMRELLLQRAVDAHLQLVKEEPTNPDAHALLANAYVMLSGLYIDPRSLEFKDNERWIPAEKYSKRMHEEFQETAKKAVEEFKILKEYAPNDPWIYMQLAYSYRDLQMPEEEKEAYRTILMLRPEDHEVRYKLGELYFKRGENARGLKVFEELKKSGYSKADELLHLYTRKELA